ncbi:hypothetical protein VEE49_21880 [Escherichia coli]|nr:hypothetical protein VEE49_21880 [Escherichia coli]
MQLMLFNLFSPALKLNTGLAILSPGAFEVHSDGIDVDNELFHYPIKKAYTPYNIHTYKTEGNDSNLLIVFYVQIMPDDFVMQLHRF